MAGLIKTILCLKHRAIPATLHFTSPNPELHSDRGPFRVRGEDGPWEWNGVLRAGVSSFGVGGTNAHIVLEEAPTFVTSEATLGPQVLLLSARDTTEALDGARSALAAELSDADEVSMPDAAYTLTRRRQEPIRMAAVVNDQEHAVSVPSSAEHDNVFTGEAPALPGGTRATAWCSCSRPGCPAHRDGPGSARVRGGVPRALRRLRDAFGAEMGFDLRAEVFDGTGRNLERTDRAQPALFTVEYALAKLAESYGIRPRRWLAQHRRVGRRNAGRVFDLPTAVKAVSMQPG